MPQLLFTAVVLQDFKGSEMPSICILLHLSGKLFAVGEGFFSPFLPSCSISHLVKQRDLQLTLAVIRPRFGLVGL